MVANSVNVVTAVQFFQTIFVPDNSVKTYQKINANKKTAFKTEK